MEPNKLENQIKETLNSREIQPSAQAWDRLDAMLSVAEEKKTKRSFGWLYIAASITVLLTAGIFFFTQNNTEIQPENDVVTNEVAKKDTTATKNPIVYGNIGIDNNGLPGWDEQMKQREKQSQTVVSNEIISNKSQTINNQRVSINNQKMPINQNQVNNHDKQIQSQNNSDVALKNPPVIETKKEVVLPNKNIPSDEQLLAFLDKTASQSSEKNAIVKVNPKNLLSQVDGELELTFRERVINKVAKNYKEVKVALANRNNE
jgi:hypothetical protein